jgi:hypothetical protein
VAAAVGAGSQHWERRQQHQSCGSSRGLQPPPPPAPPRRPRRRRPGVTTFDTSDAFGPSETLIGQFRSLSPRLADEATVITKLTFMGSPGAGALSREMVE